MMPVDERKRILLVRQYRLPARSILWELPAGNLDAGETPLQAAKRELKEETGYRAKKWKKLVVLLSQPRLSRRKDDHLPRHRPHRRRSHAHGRRTHRNPLVHPQRNRASHRDRQNPRRQDHDRLPDVGQPIMAAAAFQAASPHQTLDHRYSRASETNPAFTGFRSIYARTRSNSPAFLTK